jgi:hypothetical protein
MMHKVGPTEGFPPVYKDPASSAVVLNMTDLVPQVSGKGWYPGISGTTLGNMLLYIEATKTTGPALVGDKFQAVSDTLAQNLRSVKGGAFATTDLYVVTSIGTGSPAYAGCTVAYVGQQPGNASTLATYLGLVKATFFQILLLPGQTLDDQDGDLSGSSSTTSGDTYTWNPSIPVFIKVQNFGFQPATLTAALPLSAPGVGEIRYWLDSQNFLYIVFSEVNMTPTTIGSPDILYLPGVCTDLSGADHKASGVGLSAISVYGQGSNGNGPNAIPAFITTNWQNSNDPPGGFYITSIVPAYQPITTLPVDVGAFYGVITSPLAYAAGSNGGPAWGFGIINGTVSLNMNHFYIP